MNERLHQASADDADGLAAGFAAELVSAIGLVVGGIDAFTAKTIVLVRPALS